MAGGSTREPETSQAPAATPANPTPNAMTEAISDARAAVGSQPLAQELAKALVFASASAAKYPPRPAARIPIPPTTNPVTRRAEGCDEETLDTGGGEGTAAGSARSGGMATTIASAESAGTVTFVT